MFTLAGLNYFTPFHIIFSPYMHSFIHSLHISTCKSCTLIALPSVPLPCPLLPCPLPRPSSLLRPLPLTSSPPRLLFLTSSPPRLLFLMSSPPRLLLLTSSPPRLLFLTSSPPRLLLLLCSPPLFGRGSCFTVTSVFTSLLLLLGRSFTAEIIHTRHMTSVHNPIRSRLLSQHNKWGSVVRPCD